MGILYFGSHRTAVVMEDRILTSLMLLCASKLRRNESFLISWIDDDAIGDGRSAVWLSPGIELHFKFAGGPPPKHDPELLDQMLRASMRTSGLQLDEATLLDPPRGIERLQTLG